MTIPISPLDEVLALTKERAARLTLTASEKFIEGYLSVVVPHPGGNEAAVRAVFTSTMQLTGEFFHTHFTHPEFRGLLQERGDDEQILFCTLELSATGFRVHAQADGWQKTLSYAEDTSADMRAPILQDSGFVRRSVQGLFPFCAGPVRTRLQESWQLFLFDSLGVELLPGLWLMHTLVRDREKIIVDPARYVVHAPAFFEMITAVVLDFPTLSTNDVERLLKGSVHPSSETEGWLREELCVRLRERRTTHGPAFANMHTIPFLWQRYI